MRYVVDIETCSEADLTACGSWVYAEHPSTHILCLAYADADGDDVPKIWRVGEPAADVLDTLLRADALIAHNASFEREVLGTIWSAAFLERGRWIDTAMLCGAAGRPRSLKDACRALCLPQDRQKDAAGVRLLNIFSKATARGHKTPEQAPTDFDRLCEYCRQDVVAERELFRLLMPIADARFTAQWEMDLDVTDAGVPVDRDEVLGAAKLYDALQDEAESRALAITGGAPMRSTKALREWSASHGWPLESFAAAAVEEALADRYSCDAHPEVAEFLRLRQAASGTAGKKFAAVLSMLAKDGCCHGILVGRGGHTGRYAGRGFQPQNLPRGSFDQSLLPVVRDIARRAAAPDALADAKVDLDLVAGDRACSALSGLLRDVITPTRADECLVVSDYTAVEARILAWLAGESWVEDVFAHDGKIYERTAAAMYGRALESVTKTERTAGKIATLALGYGGGIAALHRMAAAYGERFTDDAAQNIVDTWRRARPQTVKLWSALSSAAQRAATGGEATVGLAHTALHFRAETVAGRHVLTVRLPSARKIYYWAPRVVVLENGRKEVVVESYGATGDSYGGIQTEAEGAHYSKLYGGKLTENVIQAIAFDLLLAALLRMNREGIRIRFHVHDEVVATCRRADAERTAARIAEIMTDPPDWARGLVLATDPEIMDRYKK